MTRYLQEIKRDELFAIFENIDHRLCGAQQRCSVVLLGGCAILSLDIRDRATRDIDIFSGPDAQRFRDLCRAENIQVDIVTISSTVDPAGSATQEVFNGKALQVLSVPPEDLLKTKIERYHKQDPDDIEAILRKLALPFERFSEIAREMCIDYVGDPRKLQITLEIIAERQYGAENAELLRRLNLKVPT